MSTLSNIFRSTKLRKTIAYGVALTALFVATGVHAETQEFNGDFINNILDVVNVLNMMIAMLTAPAAILAGWLLTPDWTFGDFFGLREYLYEIWILVSNIVYIIFAILLLWMAANGIFHPNDEGNEYLIKKRLPAFLVGILMVPFTWFIVSFTLTIVNKGIAVVMSIPMGTIVSIASSGDDESAWNYRIIPTYIELDFGEEGGAHGSPENLKCNSEGETADGQPCISPAEFLGNNRSGPFYMIMIYAYDIFKIQNGDFIDNEDLCNQSGENNDSCIRTLTGILARFLFSIIWAFFFSILLIALAVVLLYRAFMLWIYIMFSPMFGLAVFFKKFDGVGGDIGSKVGFKQFFILAAVPLMVACVLSFGLLFIGIIRDNPGQGGAPIFAEKDGSQAQCTSGTWTVKYCFEPKNDQEYRSYIVIGGDGSSDDGLGASLGGSEDYSITFDFGPLFSDLVDNAAGTGGSTSTSQAIQNGVGSVQDIFSYAIMNTIALVIIWIATIAAIKKDEVLAGAIEPFENFGKQVGSIVKQAPGLIPLPGGARLGSINTALGNINSNFDRIKTEGAKSFGGGVGQGGNDNIDHNAALREIDSLRSRNGSTLANSGALRKQLDNALRTAPNVKAAEEALKRAGVEGDNLKNALAKYNSDPGDRKEIARAAGLTASALDDFTAGTQAASDRASEDERETREEVKKLREELKGLKLNGDKTEITQDIAIAGQQFVKGTKVSDIRKELSAEGKQELDRAVSGGSSGGTGGGDEDDGDRRTEARTVRFEGEDVELGSDGGVTDDAKKKRIKDRIDGINSRSEKVKEVQRILGGDASEEDAEEFARDNDIDFDE